MHLADREIVEVEAELGRYVDVRRLLVRQHDIEADGLRADLVGAEIAGLHDARAAAGDDDELGARSAFIENTPRTRRANFRASS